MNIYKLGNDNYGTQIMFSPSSPQVTNAHIVISGSSGSGKSTEGMYLQYQAVKNGISVINFDISGSYTSEKIEPWFSTALKGELHRINVRKDGLGIDPLHVKYPLSAEKLIDKSEVISDLLSSVMGFGYRQRYSIYTAINNGLSGCLGNINLDNPFADEVHIDCFGNYIMDMNALRYLLYELDNPNAHSVIESLSILLDKDIFSSDKPLSWHNLLFGTPKLTIFDLNGFNPEYQKLLLEFILNDLWYYAKENGYEAKPFVTVFDEAQNLNFKNGSPISRILNEGRKFGWSAWFIMQSLSQFDKDELSRIGQSALQLYFRPPQPNIMRISKLINPDAPNLYVKQLDQLDKGSCLVKGTLENSYGITFPNVIKKVTIPDCNNILKSKDMLSNQQ